MGGDLAGLTHEERMQLYGESMEQKESEPFYWTPPNGESLAHLCNARIKWVIDTLHRECPDKRVIIVCHGEVMWAFRIMVEKIRQKDFPTIFKSKEPKNLMHNCQIIHYTRKDPKTGRIANHIDWMKIINPLDKKLCTGWETVERKKYASKELLDIARISKRIVR